jgi:ElaB/YqjD/DUF883 family membrane-anchored ribosome-binding protein
MNDYKERFEKWQREAKERFEDFDKQVGLKEKLEKGAEALKDTAQKSAEAFKEGAEKIKAEAEKSEVGKQAVGVAEDALKTAGETAKRVYEVSEPLRDTAAEVGGRAAEAAKEAGKKAGEVFNVAAGKAGEVFEDASEKFNKGAKTASSIFNFGASWTRTFDSAWKTLQQTSDWIAEKPLQAAATGASMAVGAVAGVVFTGLSSHWLFNSALPAWSVKKVGELFNDYLKDQEKLIAQGELSKAAAEKLQFERDITKYVGAPLLGSFAFASGAVMMTNIINPKTITGAPLDWLLGGNPLLEGVWFFGNGMVCFKTSYDFFMVALEDHEDLQKIVTEVKGMLPQAEPEA